MASKRVADIIAKTYFSSGEGSSTTVNNRDYSSTSSKRNYINLNIVLLLLNILLIAVVIVGWKMGVLFHANSQPATAELKLNLKQLPARVKFDFTNSKPTSSIEYSLNLGGADVSDFKAIAFDVRFNRGENHSIRVRFANGFNEIGEVGIPSLGKKWKEVVIYLQDVPGLSSWSSVKQISFILDKWNLSSGRGVMYIDNIRFIDEGT